MPENKPEKNENVIEVSAPLRAVMKRLHALEIEGGVMKERVQASVTIAVGDVAAELKRGLVGALIEGAGKTPGQAQLAEDFSTITLLQSPPPAPAAPPAPAPGRAPAAAPTLPPEEAQRIRREIEEVAKQVAPAPDPMEPAPARAEAVPAVDELERAIAVAAPVDPTKKQ